MHDFLARWAQLVPDRTAIDEVASGRRWTYAELDDRATRLAVALREGLAIPPGARVAMLAGNRAEVFEAYFGCAKAGLTFVPLNYRLTPTELEGILADAAPEALLYDDAHAPTVANLRERIPVKHTIALGGVTAGEDHHHESLLASARPHKLCSVGFEDESLVLYTSGTTGLPKGVKLPWRQVVFNAVNTCLACGLTSDDRCLACLPLFHTGGLHCLSTPLLHRGGTVVLAPTFDPGQAVSLLERGEITTTIAVPVMYRALLEAGLGKRPAPALGSLLCGGAPCPIPLIEAYHAAGLPLRQGYGLTEVGPNCFTLAPLEGPHRLGSVGRPMFHSEARLVDDQGHDVGAGTPGELLLRGPHVTTGYLHKPRETEAALDADGWFHTGDTLRCSEDGVYYVVGRKKNMFISGGENVYPTEVENVLVTHPAIADAVVLGVEDERWGQVGLAAVVLVPGHAEPSADELRAWARERLAAYKVPKHWRFVKELPVSSNGKVLRDELMKELAPEGSP